MSLTINLDRPAQLADAELDAVVGGTIFRANADKDDAKIVKKLSSQPSGFSASGTGAETHDPGLKNQSTRPPT